MSYYFVARTRIDDPEEYAHYVEKFDDVFSKFRGEYISIDEAPEVIEGRWEYNKSVILKFDSKEDFEDWYHSDAYGEIKNFRLRSSESNIILMEGLD